MIDLWNGAIFNDLEWRIT